MVETVDRFEAAAAEVAARRGVAVEVVPLMRDAPLEIGPDMVEQAATAAEAVGVAHRRVISGASHDANHVATLGPIGMLFVPCREGCSHCPEEWTEPADLAAGTRVLLELVLRLDRVLEAPCR